MNQSNDQSKLAAAIKAAAALRCEALAEQLQGLLVQGPATTDASSTATVGTPLELAVMVADLAARLAALGDLPNGVRFSISVDFQPWLNYPETDRSKEVAAIDQLLAVVLPGIAPTRDPMCGTSVHYRGMCGTSVHYRGRGKTAAGLGVSVYTDVTPLPGELKGLDG